MLRVVWRKEATQIFLLVTTRQTLPPTMSTFNDSTSLYSGATGANPPRYSSGVAATTGSAGVSGTSAVHPSAAATHPATGVHATGVHATAGVPGAVNHCLVYQLITWQDPVKTGKVFGSIILTLLAFKVGNPINWFFHIAYIGFILAAVAEYGGKLINGQGFVSKYKPPAHKNIAPKLKSDVFPALADAIGKFEDKLYRVVYAQDFECTLRAAAMLYLIFKLTSWFSIFTLIFLAVVGVFTVPAFYVRNKKEIDAVVSQYYRLIKSKTAEATADIRKQAQPFVDNLAKKSGPLGNFVQLKFPTRTAGSTVGNNTATSYGTGADAHVGASSGISTSATSATPRAAPATHSTSSGFTNSTTSASLFPSVPKSSLDPAGSLGSTGSTYASSHVASHTPVSSGSTYASSHVASHTPTEDELDQLARDINANAPTNKY